MPVSLYCPEKKEEWDAFVKSSRNATFLFERNFMDYHKDRFKDCSLLFTNHKGNLQGLLPANIDEVHRRIDSHGGLTYGGLLLHQNASVLSVKEMLSEAAEFYLSLGANTLRYKPVPFIYNTYPSEETLYWLFRAGASLVARSVSSTIDLRNPIGFSTLRKRKIKKAQSSHLTIKTEGENIWENYWEILTHVLIHQHSTHPVHTIDEIKLLSHYFPQQIQLVTVYDSDKCLAGCVLFDCGEVIHVQYISSNDIGKECGALDFLFHHLIEKYKAEGRHYFDFGISTENGGHFLNEGLIFQKEGFGGRAVCYDTYEINLNNLLNNESTFS